MVNMELENNKSNSNLSWFIESKQAIACMLICNVSKLQSINKFFVVTSLSDSMKMTISIAKLKNGPL